MRTVTPAKRFARREKEQRIEQFLKAIQEELMLDHTQEILAINVTTGKYVLSPRTLGAILEFRKRWPEQAPYLIRVDGSPIVKFRR